MQQLKACSICLVTLKIQGVTKVLHLEEIETADQILPRLSMKTEVPIETASLSNPKRGTPGKDVIVQTR